MSFPALEVLAVPPGARQLEPGVRLPVSERYAVGRVSLLNDLAINSEAVAQRHFLIERRYGRWWLLHLGATLDTLHNGAPVTNAELGHLDVITIRGALTLRFLMREEPDVRDAAMEASLIQAPDDAPRWAVYADWLQEQGAALGERMTRPQTQHDGRWLGRVAVDWADGDLDVTWRHGLPATLVVRRLANDVRSLANPVSTIVSDAVFRFLRSIDIDIEARTRSHLWVAALRELLAPLDSQRLPLLAAVSVGPLSAHPTDAAEKELSALRARLPGLRRVAFVLSPQPLLLEVLSAPSVVRITPRPGESVPVSAGALVGRLATCAVRVEAPEDHPAAQLAVRFDVTDAGWAIDDLFAQSRPFRRLEYALKVNGHDVVTALVRPGDVIELCSGLLVRLVPR